MPHVSSYKPYFFTIPFNDCSGNLVEVFTLPHVFRASPRGLARSLTDSDGLRVSPRGLARCQVGTSTTVMAARSLCGVRAFYARRSDYRGLVQAIFHSDGLGLKSVLAGPYGLFLLLKKECTMRESNSRLLRSNSRSHDRRLTAAPTGLLKVS